VKIDRSNLRHWLLLFASAANVMVAVVLRWTGWRPGPAVVLYGHKLNGNLAAIYEANSSQDGQQIPMVFLTMDPAYHRRLLSEGKRSVCMASPACIPLLAGAMAIVSDHGLHALELLARLTRIRLFDVWHGIPFKGFDADDFRVQRRYDEAWVASPLLRTLYVQRFGFDEARVAVTGYARTDRLAGVSEPLELLRARLELERLRGRKVLLFAPTWKQDSSGRSLIPFGVDEREFFDALEEVCRRTDAVLLFRAHLNSKGSAAARSERVIAVPQAEFPDSEAVLLASDVLVCDWSSIAFDFLLLDRPTIFLDVEPPFAKGFSLGPEYRFGAIVASMPELLFRIEQGLARPEEYHREFSARHARIREQVYGEFADGRSARRCLQRLGGFLLKDGSSRSLP